MRVEFVPIDKEQDELPVKMAHMATVPFPGEEVVLDSSPIFEVRVIRRQFFAGTHPDDGRVRLFVRVLPPQGGP